MEKRGESGQGNVNAYATRPAVERGVYVIRPIPADGSGAAFRRTLLFRLQPCVEPVLLAQSPSIAARIGMVDAIADDRGDQQRHQQHQAVCNDQRSEEHTYELQSLMRTLYTVFCLKKKKSQMKKNINEHNNYT